MMLKYSFNMDEESDMVELAVKNTLDKGFRTADIFQEGTKKVGCREMGNAICSEFENL